MRDLRRFGCARRVMSNTGEGMATGKVKRFDETKGFGFIAPDGGGPDVFFHHSEIQGGLSSLATGQAVEFDVTQGQKGPAAAKIRAV